MKQSAQIILSVLAAIVIAGVVLKYAGDGLFGSVAKTVADTVTEGFGT